MSRADIVWSVIWCVLIVATIFLIVTGNSGWYVAPVAWTGGIVSLYLLRGTVVIQRVMRPVRR